MSRVATHTPPKWKSEELHLFLCDIFPDHRTPMKRLDVERLAREIGRSYESLYRKLRANRLNVEWAKLLCAAANEPENLVLLKTAGVSAPTVERDFMRFFI